MANVIQRGETVMRTVPLISVEGTACECGRAYDEIVIVVHNDGRGLSPPKADLPTA